MFWYNNFGIYYVFATWLHSSLSKPYNSFGNSSAMRVSLCAWFLGNRNAVLNLARTSAECTHNHPEEIKIQALKYLPKGMKKVLSNFINR